MRIILAFLTLLWASLELAHGNPIAVDSTRRPMTMISEEVSVVVDRWHSEVSGQYSFRLEADDTPYERDTHVLVYVPVLLPVAQGADEYEKRFGAPVVSVGGRDLTTSVRNDLAFADAPRSMPLPKGWFMLNYETAIPLRLVAGQFEIQVRYTQPNFPGEAAGYVPMLPPANPAKAKIVFTPVEGSALRPVGLFSSFKPKRLRFEFIPQDRKLLQVRFVNQGVQKR